MTRIPIFLISAVPLVLLAQTGEATQPVASSDSFLLITAAAIAIERILEVFWTAMGMWKGSYWPMQSVAAQAQRILGELAESLAAMHERLQQSPHGRQGDNKDAQRSQQELAQFRARFTEARYAALDSQRLQLLAASAAQHVAYVEEKHRKNSAEIQALSTTVKVAINGLQDFLATFKDNPARRLVSLGLGAAMGCAAATQFDLDLVGHLVGGASAGPGKWLTGLIIGLGSGPTHEIVRAVQEIKKARKGENIARPDLPADNDFRPLLANFALAARPAGRRPSPTLCQEVVVESTQSPHKWNKDPDQQLIDLDVLDDARAKDHRLRVSFNMFRRGFQIDADDVLSGPAVTVAASRDSVVENAHAKES